MDSLLKVKISHWDWRIVLGIRVYNFWFVLFRTWCTWRIYWNL